MDAPYYNGAPGDPNAFDLKPYEPDCEECGAGPDEQCTFMCCCQHCDKRRQREMDEREREQEGAA